MMLSNLKRLPKVLLFVVEHIFQCLLRIGLPVPTDVHVDVDEDNSVTVSFYPVKDPNDHHLHIRVIDDRVYNIFDSIVTIYRTTLSIIRILARIAANGNNTSMRMSAMSIESYESK